MHGHPTLSLEGKKDSWGSCGLQLSPAFQRGERWRMSKTVYSRHLPWPGQDPGLSKATRTGAHRSVVALVKQMQGPGRHPQHWGLAEKI